MEVVDAAKILGVCMNEIPTNDDLNKATFLRTTSILWIELFLENVPEEAQKKFQHLGLSLRKNHSYFITKLNALFKTYRCPSCDQIINRTGNVKRHLTTCKERVKHHSTKTCIKSVEPFLTN